MMKKLSALLLAFLAFSPSAFAADFYSDFSVNLDKQETREIAPLVITSNEDSDISASHGIRIFLDQDRKILWDDVSLTFSGTAFDSQKVLSNTVVYEEGYKSVYIPVEEDFQQGDQLVITGLSLRAYDSPISNGYLSLDLNGDKVADLFTYNVYDVQNNTHNDLTAPYPVQSPEYQVNDDGTVKINWVLPPDYDYLQALVRRKLVKNGVESTLDYYAYDQFLDESLPDVATIDSLSYELISIDSGGNWGEAVEVLISFQQEQAPENDVPPVPNENDPVTEPSSDLDFFLQELEGMLNIFVLDYQSTCPSSPSSYSCLWAKIRLIHAQENTGNFLVEGLFLSQNELEMMSSKRQWPEARYRRHCLKSSDYSAEFCERMAEDIQRLNYFLD